MLVLVMALHIHTIKLHFNNSHHTRIIHNCRIATRGGYENDKTHERSLKVDNNNNINNNNVQYINVP